MKYHVAAKKTEIALNVLTWKDHQIYCKAKQVQRNVLVCVCL